MNISKYSIALLILVLSACSSKYDQLYKQKPGFYSYIAGDLRNNNFSSEYNSKVYATPASCQKVVTSLVALKTLGANYKYATEIYTTKNKGKIRDLIIKFSGDPTLTSDKLINLLQPLKNSKVTGHIILDASIFKTETYSHNLMIDDIGTNYATPVSAINIDRNLVSIKISPKKPGELAEVHVDSEFDIKSEVITNNEKTSVKLIWVDKKIHATGNINSDDRFLDLKISPTNHDKYILNKLKSILSSVNIKGRIKIIKNKELSYKNNKYINRIESDSLRELIKIALKISDNLVFDSIYLSIIHTYSKEEIKYWEQGSNIIKNLINEYFQIDSVNALFVDGSGLSRYNRIQPKTLFLLLKKGFDIPEFVDALAISGEENSTLKNRTQLSSYIKAKTGNMSGVSCLCGYSFASRNPKAFVFMSSNFSPPLKEVFEIIDNFISKDLGK